MPRHFLQPAVLWLQQGPADSREQQQGSWLCHCPGCLTRGLLCPELMAALVPLPSP